MSQHYGVHRTLEDEANRILRESLAGVTKYKDKADILTPWKEKHRAQHEILTQGGFPEPAIRQGMFHRKANMGRPDLNSRDGIAQSRDRGLSSLQAFVTENGGGTNE